MTSVFIIVIGAAILCSLLGFGVYLLSPGRKFLGLRDWPIAQGQITGWNRIQRDKENFVIVSYKFSVGDDGPYTGQESWQPSMKFRGQDLADNAERLLFDGRSIDVRYKPSDPSENTVDIPKLLEG